jgi:hypothetical protein
VSANAAWDAVVCCAVLVVGLLVSDKAAQILRDAGPVVVPLQGRTALPGAIGDLDANPERQVVRDQACRRQVERHYDLVAFVRECRETFDAPGSLR